MKIKFKRDTSFRKSLFTADHFAHPAKMDAQLLIWIVEKYTRVGETILDPMAGMGTTMLACMLGRHCILVELEQKFVDMAKANWEKVKMMPQLGCEMGECQIIQGDARNLEGIVDGIITSPPYAEAQEGGGIAKQGYMNTKRQAKNPDLVGNRSYMPENIGDAEGQIGNLPYGSIDSVITSPPYEGSDISQTHMTSDRRGDPSNPEYRPSWKRKLAEGYADTKRPYHPVDSIITSPPYEEGGGHGGKPTKCSIEHRQPSMGQSTENLYSARPDNIGNLKADSYLSAMLQVYQQCHKVLKPQGLMILVTKNFIRNKEEVRLDEDTIKLCEQAGFRFIERHYRKLPSQSFWRVIYQQKYPDAPVLDKEDILVFKRESTKEKP